MARKGVAQPRCPVPSCLGSRAPAAAAAVVAGHVLQVLLTKQCLNHRRLSPRLVYPSTLLHDSLPLFTHSFSVGRKVTIFSGLSIEAILNHAFPRLPL